MFFLLVCQFPKTQIPSCLLITHALTTVQVLCFYKSSQKRTLWCWIPGMYPHCLGCTRIESILNPGQPACCMQQADLKSQLELAWSSPIVLQLQLCAMANDLRKLQSATFSRLGWHRPPQLPKPTHKLQFSFQVAAACATSTPWLSA